MKKGFIVFAVWLSLQYLPPQIGASTDFGDDFSRNCFLIGFVANIPKEPIGLYLCTIRPQTIGFYLSLHVGIPPFPPDNQTYPNISIHKAENIFGDRFLGEKEYTSSVSVGITKTLAVDKALYIAPGCTWTDTYREYYDEFEILGKHGNYLIEDDSRAQLNLSAGFILTTSSGTNMILGVSVQPLGGSLGIGFTF